MLEIRKYLRKMRMFFVEKKMRKIAQSGPQDCKCEECERNYRNRIGLGGY